MSILIKENTYLIFLITFFNLLLTFLNIYLVVKICQLRATIALITSDLTNYESSLKLLLANTTRILSQQPANINQVREQYHTFQVRWQKIRQVIVLIIWTYRIAVKKM